MKRVNSSDHATWSLKATPFPESACEACGVIHAAGDGSRPLRRSRMNREFFCRLCPIQRDHAAALPVRSRRTIISRLPVANGPRTCTCFRCGSYPAYGVDGGRSGLLPSEPPMPSSRYSLSTAMNSSEVFTLLRMSCVSFRQPSHLIGSCCHREFFAALLRSRLWTAKPAADRLPSGYFEYRRASRDLWRLLSPRRAVQDCNRVPDHQHMVA
jgi:hypothetical protein